MRVLFCAAEATPYAKSGGLADVVGALPMALAARGHDVRLVLPRYGWIQRETLRSHPHLIEVALGSTKQYGALLEDPTAPLPVYFLEHNAYFDRPWPYGPPGSAFDDNAERFSFLSLGCQEICRAVGFIPDVFHVHDWHTALVPVQLGSLPDHDPLARSASVLTIHNIGYQGVFPKQTFESTGLGWEHFTQDELEAYGQVNFLKGGIVHATGLTTVSPTHGREIQSPEGGFGLHEYLQRRPSAVTGILNGIDTTIWNPRSDATLAANYSADDLQGKGICKTELQRNMGLPVRPETPMIGIISRLTSQKGCDIVAAALERIMQLDLQLVLLGAGDPRLEQSFLYLASRFPSHCSVTIGYSELLAHRIEAGADLFLMPSRYEPCGLNQLYSQRYGTLPIVRATGGLADTVTNYDERSGEGTGFVVYDLTPDTLFDVVAWAVHTYRKQPEHFSAMVRRAMQKDFSWDHSAAQYEHVYEQAIADHRASKP